MKPRFAALCLVAALSAACPAVSPAAEPAARDVVALAEQAAAFLRARGKAELIRRINARDPRFWRGGLCLHMLDAGTGVALADPLHPSLVGMDLLDVPDAGGRKYRRAILELAARDGRGWIDYAYKNPADGRLEPRRDYVVRVGDVVLEAGMATHR